MQPIADALKVLADPARLRILKALMLTQKEKAFCVRDLACRLDISQPNISHHLKVLKNAGFIACEKHKKNDQRFAYYSVNIQQIETLFQDVRKSISQP